MASPISIILCAVFVLSVVKLARVLLSAYATPLRRIPGPWYAALTPLRLKLAVLTGKRVHYIHELHSRYGPIVRVSPTEIAINDVSSFKEIHRVGSGFNKTDWYRYLNPRGPTGTLGIFQMANPKDHAARRKLMARGFSKSYLRQQWEPVVRQKIEFAVARIREEGKLGCADVLKWWTFMATDVSTHVSFGESFGMLELGHKTPYIEALEHTLMGTTIQYELPWLHMILSNLPLPALQAIFHNREELSHYGKLAVKNSKVQGYGSSNVFATVIAEAEKGESSLTDDDVEIEAGGIIIAGDTTAISLTYLIWSVLRQPQLQIDLEEEVAALSADFTEAQLEALPLLNATIEETLRLYGAAPGALPRMVPPGGATLGGYYIPPGITVATQAFSLHRDEELFPRPDTFDHTRWLPGTEMALSDAAKAAYAPFGAGTRTCIGVHLARMELRLGAAMFLRECKGARLNESTTLESMDIENFFLIAPKSHRCEIVL